MINLKHLRESPELYIEAARRKRINVDIEAFLKVDEEYRSLKSRVEELRAEQNRCNKELRNLSGAEKEEMLSKMKAISGEAKEQGSAFKTLEEEWEKLQLLIPSLPDEQVPDGKDEDDNVPLRHWGEVPQFSFELKDHVELGKTLDIIDIERGVKVAGARNYFLKGDGARLQHAVLSLAMDLLHEQGFTIFDPPLVVLYEAMMGTGYFPGGEEQAFHLDTRDDAHYLIGTSEVPVASYHMDEILPEEELPKRYAGISPCFRREAGTYGRDTHGIYRVHQFSKVEQVVICKADKEESLKHHEAILRNAELMLQKLELPYRVSTVCAGDMGQGQVLKHDIETWMPSRGKYGETHSCSTFYEFQARRLKLRYRDGEGNIHYCYTLNNTCIASPRVLIPLLEMHQQEDGSVVIPEALRSYMGGQERIVPKG
jgi:seryl-tRNA synthetase